MIVEQAAPNATALARHHTAKVGGVHTAVLHLPYADYNHQQAESIGLPLEDAALQTVTVETAWTLYKEVVALEEEIQRQGPGAHRRLLDRVGGAVDVVNSFGEIVAAVAKVAKVLAGT